MLLQTFIWILSNAISPQQAHGKAYDNATDALREEIFQRVDAQIEAHNNRSDVPFHIAWEQWKIKDRYVNITTLYCCNIFIWIMISVNVDA